MTGRRQPRGARRLLERVVRDDALVGDLLELAAERPPRWLWWQVGTALLRQCWTALSESPRRTVESALVGTALLALLAFASLVAATLLLRLLTLADSTWAADSGRLGAHPAVARLAAGCAGALLLFAAGRQLARCRCGFTPLALGCAAVVTAVACLDVYLFVPASAAQVFPADAAWLLAALAAGIAGLAAGIESRSSCAPLPWS